MLKIQEINIEYHDDEKGRKLVWELWKEGFTGTVRNGVVSVWGVEGAGHFDFLEEIVNRINEEE